MSSPSHHHCSTVTLIDPYFIHLFIKLYILFLVENYGVINVPLCLIVKYSASLLIFCKCITTFKFWMYETILLSNINSECTYRQKVWSLFLFFYCKSCSQLLVTLTVLSKLQSNKRTWILWLKNLKIIINLTKMNATIQTAIPSKMSRNIVIILCINYLTER